MRCYETCTLCGAHLDPGEVCECTKKTALGATNTQSGKEINLKNDSFSHYSCLEPALSRDKPYLMRVAKEIAGYGDKALPVADALLGLASRRATIDRLMMKFNSMTAGERAYTLQLAAALEQAVRA